MSEPRVELAVDVVRRLRREASEADWAGDVERADRLRRAADAIERRGETWTPNF